MWSPSCCNFVLKYTANQQRALYDADIVEAVNKNFYVDDFLKSVPSVDDAVRIVNDASKLLQAGGFHLTKWVSSASELLDAIPSSDISGNCLLYTSPSPRDS